MPLINKRRLGAAGENLAVKHLLDNNYSILKTNFRVGRLGEIDIIASDGEYICFIEVKTRRSNAYGSPCEAVTAQKQRKIHQLASVYLSNTYNTGKCVRFDVIEVMLSETLGAEILSSVNQCKLINHIKNAF